MEIEGKTQHMRMEDDKGNTLSDVIINIPFEYTTENGSGFIMTFSNGWYQHDYLMKYNKTDRIRIITNMYGDTIAECEQESDENGNHLESHPFLGGCRI